MVWTWLLALTLAAQAVTGVVKDSTGGTVSGATVIMRGGAGAEQRTVTGPDGTFSFPDSPGGQVTLIVRAGGFAESVETVSSLQSIEVVLALPRLGEAVTVTPTRGEASLATVPASVNVIDREQIQASPAVIADDVLRQIPTFSLFRRTSAVSANPTAQGVSLRGIGPSGVSRTLVLIDNVPFNDPFGGWVYWTKVALDDVDRIEVVNGSSSSLYGNYAMGGVINIVSRRAERSTLEFRPQYGSRNTSKLDVFGSEILGKVGVTFNGSVFDTDGFPQVIANERGPVDTKAGVAFNNVNVRIDYAPTANVRAFLRGGYFTEKRDNAKIATIGNPIREANNTVSRSLNTGVRLQLPGQSDLQVTLFGDGVSYHQNFLAVTAPGGVLRSGGRITLNQFVPTKNVGGMVQWSRAFAMQHYFTAGTDWRWVEGESREDVMDITLGITRVTRRVAGGRQKSLGAFVQNVYTPIDRLTITGSARVDRWRSYGGHHLETSVATTLPTANHRPTVPEREDTAVSPRLAALYRVTDRVNVWGDVAFGFRAPTLNELYRRFSVGALLTLPDENLGPERLRGGEAGVSVTLPGNVVARTTWYDNRMKDPVSTKVRLDLNALGNTVQRTNLGRTRIWGLQTDVEARLLSDTVKVSGAYLYNDATVTENPLDAPVVGKYLVQVPKHRGTAQIAYSNPTYVNVALSLQMIGRQFDDVLNTATVPGQTKPGLPAFTSVDFNASRHLSPNIEVFVGVQNLLDKEYVVQTNPTTVGAPRLVTGGMKIRFSGR